MGIAIWTAGAQAQTLADVARLQREGRKAADGSRIFTNESIVRAAPGPAALPPPAAMAGGARADDEKHWRAAFAQANQEIKRGEDKVRQADLKVTDLSSRLLREGRAAVEKDIRADLLKATSDQTLLQAELQQARLKISDLEDALRRAGGLPGWAR